MSELKSIILFVLLAVCVISAITWPLVILENNAKERRAQMYIDGAVKITEMLIKEK